ncbi:redoxin domain-containing protein [Alteromonas sp. LMIT007]|uniref:Alkyl hydroperoxide reductase C n=1 Tax=Opacimonas viscosa TaxID=2961944 RepID=A0AA41X581_9ALTE|nr:redoxin domain-containing protein [Opacimonas viscosa]
MAKINSVIPSFETQAFVPGQSDFVTISSDDLKGQWSVFLFYPADFTFVCP